MFKFLILEYTNKFQRWVVKTLRFSWDIHNVQLLTLCILDKYSGWRELFKGFTPSFNLLFVVHWKTHFKYILLT